MKTAWLAAEPSNKAAVLPQSLAPTSTRTNESAAGGRSRSSCRCARTMAASARVSVYSGSAVMARNRREPSSSWKNLGDERVRRLQAHQQFGAQGEGIGRVDLQHARRCCGPDPLHLDLKVERNDSRRQDARLR